MPYPETVEIATGGQTLDGCGGDPAVLLAGGEWVVESIDGVPPAAGALPTLLFDGAAGEVAARADATAGAPATASPERG
ncbi:hypothetical protein [Rubellimicrobium thermophilum]|nr:hypothetical protein [Rubellimicrobium thermophilum]